MATQTIETYLPLFSGFYGNIYDNDFEIEQILEEENKSYEEVAFHYYQYHLDISKEACAYVERELNSILDTECAIEFIDLISPREYNFSNDRIDTKITIDLIKVRKYINKNIDAFNTYIADRFTSCSGFISFYPNNAKEFLLLPITDYNFLGTLLDFIIRNEGIEESEILEYSYGKVNLDYTIK